MIAPSGMLLTALCLSLGLNWLVRHVARTRGWLFSPASERHIHKLPVPRLGGVGVFFSFCLVLLFTTSRLPTSERHVYLLLLVPASLIFAVGLVDDIWQLPARTKLVFQILCGATLFFIQPPALLAMRVGGWSVGPAVACAITIAWVVLVSNSINLIDGVDGLAGGISAVSILAVGVVLGRSGNQEGALLAFTLLGSVLGFLKFNCYPATIFLGDSGSLFLGFMISALGMQCASQHALASTLPVPVAILALPLTETGVSVLRRFLSGRPLFSPDREHLHHKLLDRGFTQRQVVYVLYAVSIVSAIAGMLMTTGNDYVFKASCIALVGIIATGVGAIGYVEFVEIARIFHRVTEQRRVISNDVALRKLAGRIRNARCLGEVQSEVRGTFVKMEFDGCDLVLMPSFNNRVHCRETSKTASWGYGIRTHAQVLQCWSMEIDLFSERFGKLGWLRLSRRMDRGSLLFDANVLVSELQPALLVALEHCVIGECQQVKEESVPSHRSVGLELEAPAHSYSVQASTLTG